MRVSETDIHTWSLTHFAAGPLEKRRRLTQDTSIYRSGTQEIAPVY